MNKPTKHFSAIQESSIAKALGWSVVSGSGARDFHPGDIRSDAWLGECKTHTESGKPIQFNASTWVKICEEASSQFKYPALFVDDGSQKLSNTWVMFLLDANCPDNISKYDYPEKYKINIKFDCKELLHRYKNLMSWSYSTAVWTAKIGGTTVGILPFEQFQKLFEEYSDD